MVKVAMGACRGVTEVRAGVWVAKVAMVGLVVGAVGSVAAKETASWVVAEEVAEEAAALAGGKGAMAVAMAMAGRKGARAAAWVGRVEQAQARVARGAVMV